MQTHAPAPAAPAAPSLPADRSAGAPGSRITVLHLPSYLLGLLTALSLVGGLLALWPRPQPAAMRLQPPPTAAPSPSPPPTAPPTGAPTPPPLVVFVSGAVAQPGLYTLGPTARIGDAVAAAGGLLPGVDEALINQAQPVVDGAQVHIPAPTPAPALPPADLPGAPLPAPPAPAPPAVAQPPAGLSLPTPTPTAAQAAPATPADRAATAGLADGVLAEGGLIDVNSAGSAALESLPGIGPAKAQAIIDNRPYATIDELDRVPGIGPATLAQIRPYVTVVGQ